ncbi:large ribosomal subunit protein uL23m isoform X1 [Bubalus kerabau]|uniref:large ribosomal subunit protein uL23m isoform X1 n=2 Tax=Bubalus carabanensis TaxID=3119969 RepID=UPI00244EC97B|nr:39S ribosomal protein L23, mitochondrial isoform X1 [Bubalus carabanensis]
MARNVLYPLYQLGNPQLRVFRTNFFIQLVRPGTAQPEDTVQFRIPMEMTRVDLRNYLERIYNVPVAAVRTRVQHGSNRRRDHRNVRIKQPDYKVAYVQLIRVPAPHPFLPIQRWTAWPREYCRGPPQSLEPLCHMPRAEVAPHFPPLGSRPLPGSLTGGAGVPRLCDGGPGWDLAGPPAF